jgi:hypothetical protein
LDAQFGEAHAHHSQVMRVGPVDYQFAAGCGRKPDVGSNFHEIGADGKIGSVKLFHTLNGEDVASDTAYPAAHCVDHVAEILHVGLGCRVPQDCGSFGQGCGHDGVFGRGDGSLIEEDIISDEPGRIE